MTTGQDDDDDEVGHGPDEFFYDNLPGPEQTPVIYCLCGWSERGKDWMMVGWAFDDHLKETRTDG